MKIKLEIECENSKELYEKQKVLSELLMSDKLKDWKLRIETSEE